MVRTMSRYNNQIPEKKILEATANYYFSKSFDTTKTAEKIMPLTIYRSETAPIVVKSNTVSDTELELIVTEVIQQIGIPTHIRGFHYLREAIILSVKNREIITLVTKMLYPTVANKYQTTASCVERAIRHAIEVAWNRGDIDILNSYFGYTIQNGCKKPTNSELIATISDKLRLKFKMEAEHGGNIV